MSAMGSGLMSGPASWLRRVVVGVFALGLVATLVPAAAADTESSISVQEKRLKWLEGIARQKQARVASVQGSVRALASQIRESNLALDGLDRRHRRHQDQLIDTMAEYDRLRGQMDTAAGEMYMRGAIQFIGAVMDARTLSDAGDAVNYTSSLLSQNRRLAEQTAVSARDIAALKAQDAAMIQQRAATLLEQRRRQDELVGAFAEGQRELEEVAAIREEVAQLLVSLRRQLRAEDLAALGGTMPYGPWAERFLGSIGAPVVRGNLVAVVAWQVAEGTLARWNPLATTWKMPGSTPFNGHRVQNYVSVEQGLEASLKTLSRPRHRYEAILSSLREGAAAMTTARAINASDWCRGCADGQYVVELIPIVERYFEKYANRRA